MQQRFLYAVFVGIFCNRDDAYFGIQKVFLFDDGADGSGIAVRIQDDQIDRSILHRVPECVRVWYPVAMCDMPGVPERTVDQCD